MNQVLRETATPAGCRLQIVEGDITKEVVDAIVNAANSYLQHGGGVAGVISLAGGPVIQRESDLWVQEHGPVSHREPVTTSAGRLTCQYVIHAVGPVWGSSNEEEKLAAAVGGALRVADELGLESIAMPAISTGIFGFPKQRAAQVILAAILEYLQGAGDTSLKRVRLVLFDSPTANVFLAVFDRFQSEREAAQH